jgi:diguanylate cyclase
MEIFRSPHTQPENHRLARVIATMVCVGFPAHSLFIPLFFWMGVPLLAWFNFLSVAAWLYAGWKNYHGRHWSAVNILTLEVVAHATMATYSFGWGSGFQTYLMPMITFVMVNYRMKRHVMIFQASGIVFLYVLLYMTTRTVTPPVSAAVLEVMHYINVVIVFTALCVITYYFREASLESERRMEKLASTDMLTHLPNRRRMREMLEVEHHRARRTTSTFGIILTDIDYFKKVNDAYGHDCGDFVLQNVASRLRSALRDHDVVSRWGGEEFLALLPDTTLDGAHDAAERMRQVVEREPICFCGSDVAVTLTLGVAICDGEDSIDAAVTRADVALYDGKRNGRNRVVSLPLRERAAG